LVLDERPSGLTAIKKAGNHRLQWSGGGGRFGSGRVVRRRHIAAVRRLDWRLPYIGRLIDKPVSNTDIT
jgi:hypothetical protein